MVTYLSPFIPSLSTHTAPLWELLKKGLRVHVEHNLPGSLQPDKAISLQGHHTLILWHLETCHCSSWCIKEGTWSCTPARWASSFFASKALTPTEQWYANIEWEMLACIFGAEWFHTYVFGCAFMIESDQLDFNGCCSGCRTMMSPSSIFQERRC